MNVFIKNLLKIAGVALVAGIVLMIAGFSMDTSMFERPGDFSYDISNISFGGEDRESAQEEKLRPRNTASESKSIENTNRGETAGSDRAYQEDTEETNNKESSDYPITYKNATSLDLDISYGMVTIKEGDTFSVDVNEFGRKYVKSKLENGVWKISQNKIQANQRDGNSEIKIFGVTIQTDKENISWSHDIKIEITLPVDFKAEDLEISIGAGALKADYLAAETAKLNVGAGSIRIDELSVDNASDYSVGAGELIIDNLTAKDITLDCAVGNTSLSGTVTGDNYITCAIGNVSMDIDGDEEDYNYEVKTSIGSVNINKHKYTGIASKEIKNKGAQNTLSLNCDIGKIELNIR